MVRQVPVVAALMIAEGVLETIAGIFYAAIGPLMRPVFETVMRQQPSASLPPGFGSYMMAFYIGAGLAALAAGVLKVVAGIRNLSYRGRVLGIVGLFSGLVAGLTCYCIPTALALLVYGLIVYLNSDVARAFEMGQTAMPAAQVRSSFP